MNNSIKKILFLGPIGTYSDFACEKFREKFNLKADFEPVSTITKIIETIDDDCTLAAILPMENSIEGIVRPTLDGIFSTKNDVKIQAQTQINIENCLISYSKKEEITHIISHPQPLSQCQKYISANFGKDIILEGASSTAAATAMLKDKGKGYASIGNEYCANLLNIPVLEKNINDNKDNQTRFVLVSRQDFNLPDKTRTSLVFSTKQKPGTLAAALEVFRRHDINLIYIESRPSKRALGEYVFFADIDKSIEGLDKVFLELEKVTNYYKILGSYPVV